MSATKNSDMDGNLKKRYSGSMPKRKASKMLKKIGASDKQGASVGKMLRKRGNPVC